MKKSVILVLSLMVTTACERNSYSTFSRRYDVNFSCDISMTPFDQLKSPGRFLTITKSNGKLNITDVDGNKYTHTLNAQQNSFIMGNAGLILGAPILDYNGSTILAFDLGCPECDDPLIRLSIDQNGNATCSECKGKWDMNNNGFSIGNSRIPLDRYPTVIHGDIVSVNNL